MCYRASMVLSENEIRWSEGGELPRIVTDALKAFGGTNHPPLEVVQLVVHNAACEILLSRPNDCVAVTRHPAPGTTYHLTATFLPDEFRNLVTSAAYERLADLGHPVTI